MGGQFYFMRNFFILLLFGIVGFSFPIYAMDADSFYKAAKSNNLEMLRRAIAEKMDVNSKSEDSYTALIYAAYYGHDEAVKLLLDAGAEPCVGDKKGNTALMGAIFKGVEPVFNLLVDRCDVNQLNSQGQTPLMYASLFGREAMAQILLEKGANKDLRDANGYTAEGLAESQWNQAMVKVLQWTQVIKKN